MGGENKKKWTERKAPSPERKIKPPHFCLKRRQAKVSVPEQVSSAFFVWSSFAIWNTCQRAAPVDTCMELSRFRPSCMCVKREFCLWLLSITPQGNWSPSRPPCRVKEQTLLLPRLHLDSSSKPPPPTHDSAAILERLTRAEIAALRPGTHSRIQIEAPTLWEKRGNKGRGDPTAGRDIHPVSVKDWRSSEFWARSRTFCLLHLKFSIQLLCTVRGKRR